MIQLPRHFIKSLVKKPKLKVQISSELLNKLLQSIHTKKNHHQIDIQSQFDTIVDMQESKAVHAKAEIKTPRLPIVRHIARTKSDGSDRKKILAEKHSHPISHKHQRKKKHSSNTSHEEIYSKKSSLTNVTQSVPSSD